MGLSIEDLNYLTLGTVYDMMTEKMNDDYDWPLKATTEDVYALAGIERKTDG